MPMHWETGVLALTQRLWLCSCSQTDHAVLAGWSILKSVVRRAFAGLRTLGDVQNQGYVIAEYVISSRRPMLKNRKLIGL